MIVVEEEEEPVEVPVSLSREDSVNGPAWTSSSEPIGGSESSHAWRGWLDYCSLLVRSVTVDQSDSAEDVG